MTELVSKISDSLVPDLMLVQPDYTGQHWPTLQYMSTADVTKLIGTNNGHTEHSIIGAPNLADTEDWKNYAKAPYNAIFERKFRESLGGKDLNSPQGEMVFPPFINSHKTLAGSVDNLTCFNTSKANKVLLFAKIMHLLYAEYKNVQIEMLEDDLECERLCDIGMKYITTLTTRDTQVCKHGGMTAFHPATMGNKNQFFHADQDNHLLIISASFFVMLIDGALDSPKEYISESDDEQSFTANNILDGVKMKLRELMAALDKISHQVQSLNNLIFDTSENLYPSCFLFHVNFCFFIFYTHVCISFWQAIAFFLLRSLPLTYRKIGSTNITNEGVSGGKNRTSQDLVDQIILRCLIREIIHLLSHCGLDPKLNSENDDEWNGLLLKFYDIIQWNQKVDHIKWTSNNELTAKTLSTTMPRGLGEFVLKKTLAVNRRALSSFTYLLIILKNQLVKMETKNYGPQTFQGGSIWVGHINNPVIINVGIGMKASKENIVATRLLTRFCDLAPLQASFEECKTITTMTSLFAIAVQTSRTSRVSSHSLSSAIDLYSQYTSDNAFVHKKVLIDIQVKEPKARKKTTADSDDHVPKISTSPSVMIDEAKGDVTNLLACLIKPDVSFSRDEVEQLTLDLVQTLTGKKFKSAVDAHANMCNDLKLKATFRPVLFLQVITSIISASNNSLQSIKVERTDVNLSLAFGTTDSDVGLFHDDEKLHSCTRIMLSIPAKYFVIIKAAVFDKVTVPKSASEWVKRLVGFFKTVETNDDWVSTLSNCTDPLEKIVTDQLVFVAQKEYMANILGLENYKSYHDTFDK